MAVVLWRGHPSLAAYPLRRLSPRKWPKSSLGVEQAKRLKELERENARLRKAVSDLTLEKVILKEAASGKW